MLACYLPSLVTTLIWSPKLCWGFITHMLLVAVMSNSSQPSSEAHTALVSSKNRSESLKEKQTPKSIRLAARRILHHCSGPDVLFSVSASRRKSWKACLVFRYNFITTWYWIITKTAVETIFYIYMIRNAILFISVQTNKDQSKIRKNTTITSIQ